MAESSTALVVREGEQNGRLTEGGHVQDRAADDVTDEPTTNDDQATDLLVEEVSIDGLCGVY